MNTKKDEPDKGTAGPAGSGSNKPHATLDLKATVVDPKPGKDAGKEKGSAAGAPDAARTASGPAPASRSSAAGPHETAKSGATGSQTASAGSAATPKPREPQRPAPSAAKPVGYGGIFTHLAAGVIGGIVALLAADMLAGQLGLSGTVENTGTSALQQRVAALEAAGKQSATTPQIDAKLKDAVARLDKLEPLAGRVDGLAQEQSELAQDVTTMGERIGAGGADAGLGARIAKLEEQLAALSAAAASDPDGNGLPQLAALTGQIADLESTLTAQLAALRKSVNQELDTRLATVSEASEAARSGTRRIDRELAGVKAESTQLDTRLNAVGAQSDRANALLATAQQELAKLKAEVGARIAQLAKPEDIAAGLAPLNTKLTALEQEVQGVVKSEADRKATAERIVLSLELANLKRAIDRGGSYAAELAQARRLADGGIDLSPLARFEDTGVPTLAELRKDFKAVAFKMIDAEQQPVEGSIVDRLLAGAKSVVRVRKISHSADDKTVEAVVARMETALAEDRLDDVLQEAETLPQPAQEAAKDFLAKVKARNAVDRALSAVDAQLKASLVAPAGGAGTAKE